MEEASEEFRRAMVTQRRLDGLAEPHRSVLEYVYRDCGPAVMTGWRREETPETKRVHVATGKKSTGRPQKNQAQEVSLWPQILEQIGGESVLAHAEATFAAESVS